MDSECQRQGMEGVLGVSGIDGLWVCRSDEALSLKSRDSL